LISGTHEEDTIQATHGSNQTVSDMTECRHLIRTIQRTDILADKGDACAAHDALLKERRKKSRMMKKAALNRPLPPLEKRFNKRMCKARFNIKQAVGTLKRRFFMMRCRTITAPKVNGEMAFNAIGLHLLQAAHSVTF
jgi:hypothetical protein